MPLTEDAPATPRRPGNLLRFATPMEPAQRELTDASGDRLVFSFRQAANKPTAHTADG